MFKEDGIHGGGGEFGAGYQAGLTLSSGMIFAYIAVDYMIKASNLNRDT